MVFPDTSPRTLDAPNLDKNEDWKVGYGAGHYCDATEAHWSENFNMYTYVTRELPEILEQFFLVDTNAKSVMGHNMGEVGALTIALKKSSEFK